MLSQVNCSLQKKAMYKKNSIHFGTRVQTMLSFGCGANARLGYKPCAHVVK